MNFLNSLTKSNQVIPQFYPSNQSPTAMSPTTFNPQRPYIFNPASNNLLNPDTNYDVANAENPNITAPLQPAARVSLDDLIQQNFLTIRHKMINRYQDRFRNFAILASKGRMEPQDAINRINTEFPSQATTTADVMSDLFYR